MTLGNVLKDLKLLMIMHHEMDSDTRIQTQRNNFDPDKLSRPEISDSVKSQFEYFQVFWDLFNMAQGF